VKNVYINVGNNNWVKMSNQSNNNFNQNNSLLSFIYEYEFKNNHEQILDKKFRSKRFLKRITNASNNLKPLHVQPQFSTESTFMINEEYRKEKFNENFKIENKTEDNF
jgi:hypothetical protein